MTQEEILKYNKRCAEILGWEKCDTVYRTIEYYNNEKVVGSATHPKHMKFHSDWNLIMEVVEKIEELDIVASFQIEQTAIYIWKSSESSTFEDIEVGVFAISKKEAVVKAVNQFLNWYKEQNKNTYLRLKDK